MMGLAAILIKILVVTQVFVKASFVNINNNKITGDTRQAKTTNSSNQDTRILLSASGFDPITSNSICPAQEATAVVIDGSAYTGGPGTIRLYQCTFINDEYDLMKIELIGFESGLWFEIAYNVGSIDLKITSLDDYSGYWTRVKNSYVGDYPFQTSTDHYPQFSWETVPRWISFRRNPNSGPFTQEDIATIANNNYLSWYGLGRPEDVINMAESIKAINPHYKMLLYWNSESYWGSEIDTFSESYLQDGPGGTGDRPLYDHSNPAMRKWWIDHALFMDSDDAIDGVFADNTRGPATTLKSEMIKDLADTLPADSLKLGNFIRQRDDDGNRFRMNYEEGTYFENQHIGPVNQPDHESIIVSMQLAREASWKQKVVMWNGSRRNCGCFDGIADSDIPPSCVGFINVDDEPRDLIMQDLELSLAEYLMVAEEFSYFGFNVSPDASCERWRWDSSGLPQFQKPLGEPVGPPIRDGNTFARHFEFVSVKIDFETEETTFDWHDTGDFPTAAPFSHSFLPTQAPAPTTSPFLSPSPTLNPTVSHQPSGACMPVDIRILPDEHASETSWNLFNPRGDVINSSDQEDPLLLETLFVLHTCLRTYCADDLEYQFVIRDSYGDGIIAPGFYEIYVDGDLIKKGGDFTTEDVTKFSSCAPTSAPTINPHSCNEDPEVTVGRKKPDGAIVQHTCGWLGTQSDKVIQAWCRTTKWPNDTIPPASYACPNTCDTCSAAPSSAPTSVCSDSATEKFFFKANEGGNAVGKKCSIFEGRNEKWIKKICNIPVPVDHIDSGYLSAKVVCPETCGNCCALEIEHLENKVEYIENENEELENVNEELENENQRYKFIFKLYNITF